MFAFVICCVFGGRGDLVGVFDARISVFWILQPKRLPLFLVLCFHLTVVCSPTCRFNPEFKEGKRGPFPVCN